MTSRRALRAASSLATALSRSILAFSPSALRMSVVICMPSCFLQTCETLLHNGMLLRDYRPHARGRATLTCRVAQQAIKQDNSKCCWIQQHVMLCKHLVKLQPPCHLTHDSKQPQLGGGLVHHAAAVVHHAAGKDGTDLLRSALWVAILQAWASRPSMWSHTA